MLSQLRYYYNRLRKSCGNQQTVWQVLYCQAIVWGRYMSRPSDFPTQEGKVYTCSAKAEAQSHQDRGQSTGQETPQAQRRVERWYEENS